MVKVGQFVNISEDYDLPNEIGWSECYKQLLPGPYEVTDIHFMDEEDEYFWNRVRVRFVSADGITLRWWICREFITIGEGFTKNIDLIKREKRSW
jgi:hypothetical protein